MGLCGPRTALVYAHLSCQVIITVLKMSKLATLGMLIRLIM